MKKLITEIRGQDTAELKAKLSELRKEKFGLRFHGAAETVNKTTRHREIRRTIARILMVLAERDKGAAPVAAAAKTASKTAAKTVGAAPAAKSPKTVSTKK